VVPGQQLCSEDVDQALWDVVLVVVAQYGVAHISDRRSRIHRVTELQHQETPRMPYLAFGLVACIVDNVSRTLDRNVSEPATCAPPDELNTTNTHRKELTNVACQEIVVVE
jgi:hypothetical protein